METYLLMIYVTTEQQNAIENLFLSQNWTYKEACIVPVDKLKSEQLPEQKVTIPEEVSDPKEVSPFPLDLDTHYRPKERDDYRAVLLNSNDSSDESDPDYSQPEPSPLNLSLTDNRTSCKQPEESSSVYLSQTKKELLSTDANTKDSGSASKGNEQDHETTPVALPYLAAATSDDRNSSSAKEETMPQDPKESVPLSANAEKIKEILDTNVAVVKNQMSFSGGSLTINRAELYNGTPPRQSHGSIQNHDSPSISECHHLPDQSSAAFSEKLQNDKGEKMETSEKSQQESTKTVLSFPRKKTKFSKLKHRPRVLKCVVCGKIYQRQFSFEMHMRSHSGIVTCKICHRYFVNLKELNAHASIHSPTEDINRNEMLHSSTSDNGGLQVIGHQYLCTYENYGQVFSYEQQHIDYGWTQAGEKIVVCKIATCPSKFYPASAQLNHISTYHPELSFKCKLCSVNFDSTTSLSEHVCSKKDMYYSCACGKMFSSQSHLMTHQRVCKKSSSKGNLTSVDSQSCESGATYTHMKMT